MEFSFKIIPSLQFLVEKEGVMVVFAAIGVPIMIGVFALVQYLLKKLSLGSLTYAPINLLIVALGISWLPGFIIQILLSFCGVSAARLFLIEITLLLTCFVFCIFNYRSVMQEVIDNHEDILPTSRRRNRIQG